MRQDARSFDCATPRNRKAGIGLRLSCRSLLLGWGRCSLGSPESGSDSWVSQMLLSTVEERVLGSLVCTKARDVGFSVLDTAEAARCHRRVENRGGPSGRLWPGGKGKRAGRTELQLVTVGTRVLVSRWVALVGGCGWSAGRPPAGA